MSIQTISLAKSSLKTALAEALYNEILSNSSNYYYFLGKTLEWAGGSENVEQPQISQVYENKTRESLIFLKKITSADVSFVVPRYDWLSGQVFDMYDDNLGGFVTATCTGLANSFNLSGTFDPSQIGVGYLVTGTNIPAGALVEQCTPTTITLSLRTTGAVNGSVTFTNIATSGATSLTAARFYCITNERNVYKCLFNNNGAPSTIKPYSTTHEVINTDDGYVWKFLYTIPNSLVNRFMSVEDMPVLAAIKNQYYSQGSIFATTIESYGQDYAPGDYLVVVGDGHLRDNVYRITDIAINDGGSGYTTPPTVTIQAPFDYTSFAQDTLFLQGQYVEIDSRIYEVLVGGTTGTTDPIHTGSDPVANGQTSLKFVGYIPTTTATLDEDTVDDIEIAGVIGTITPTLVGSGYDPLNPPDVTITGDGTGAAAYAEVTADGYVANIKITNKGSGYTTAIVTIDPPTDPEGDPATAIATIFYGYGYSFTPSVSVDPPFTADFEWEAEGSVTTGDIIQVGSFFYEALDSGLLGTIAPTHITGTATNGAVDLEFIGQTASAIVIVQKTAALMTPIITNGQITNVIVNDPGVGYTTADVLAFSLVDGTGASIVPNISYGDINSRQGITELLSVPGTINAVQIINPGAGYAFAPSTSNGGIVVTGDGEGFECEAVLVQGAISKIIVTNPGVNYTKASISINGNEGATQAYARPIISPPKGHGKDAVRELFASVLSLSTTIARDRNQGFVVDNDYRQLGIIKNPRVYNSEERFNGFSASACFSITGNFNYSLINVEGEPETTLTDQTTGKRYRVVAKPDEDPGASVPLLIQSLDSAVPVIGDTVEYNETEQATLTAVSFPSIDKYSGDMLFIDNRSAFQPTTEQTISIKTAIRL